MIEHEIQFINIYNEAKQFKILSLELIEPRFIQNIQNVLGAPFVVNSMFAIELYLKAILSYHNCQFGHTHNLKELFRQLPKNYKDRLKKKMYGIEEFMNKENISYEKWRYSFEQNNLYNSISEIRFLLNLLDSECIEMKNKIK